MQTGSTYADADSSDVAVRVYPDGDPGVFFVGVEVDVQLFVVHHQGVVVLQELVRGEWDVMVGVKHAESN